MSAQDDSRVNDLLVAVTLHISANKGKYVERLDGETHILRLWLSYLRSTISNGVCDELLGATQATIIEVAGCLSLGLIRPAIFSTRTQLEIMLAWIYFNDHTVEWLHIQRHLRDYPMRARLWQYFTGNSDRFQQRFRILGRHRIRRNEDPYGLLSIHVHGSSTMALPQVGPLSDLVGDDKTCLECIDLQREVAEYLSEILAAWYADRWYDYPPDIAAAIRGRLPVSELKEFCS